MAGDILCLRRCEEKMCIRDRDYAGHVIMNSDGTAMVIAGTAAWRFLP